MTPTQAEIAAQVRSYVRAEMGSDADEAEYRAAVHAGDTAALDRLDRAADARMDAADAILQREG